jgi:uncharacterized protein (DUF1800 family)
MVGKFRLCSSLTVAAAVCLALVAPAALAQSNPPAGQPRPGKISEADLRKLRELEVKSGARTKAAESPTVQALKGPPLNDREKVIHVLNRMSFGPRPGQVDKVLADGGWEKWVDQQLNPDSVEDAALDDELPQRYPWLKLSLQEIKQKYPMEYMQQYHPELRQGLRNSVLHRAVASNRQFKEVMTEFWRNHFFVNQPAREAPTRSWTAVDYEEQVIRKHAFGKFKNMLYASATHPAMLEYLDNYMSKAGAWNENYAREVMELHTLGADRGYNEADVLELSKVLTGWTYDPKDLKFIFRQEWHQRGTKKVLGKQIPGGQQGGEQALYMLATHPNCAEFISFKLCRYLVNDNPPQALVRKVATVFRESGGDLPKVYRAILTSPEFMERSNYRAKFKTPFEFTVSAIRATDAKLADGGETVNVIAKMGEPIYDCDDPTGFYDQAEAWMDAGVLTSRWDYAWKMARGSIRGVTVPDEFFSRYASLEPTAARDKMVHDVIGADIGDRTAQSLTQAAQSPNDRKRMLAILLGSPDFQQQ